MSEKNMTKCKACGKDIAKGVKKCPNCGKDQRNFFMKHKIITGILILILISSIGSSLGGDDQKTAGKNDTPDANKVVATDTDQPEKEIQEVEKEVEEEEVEPTEEPKEEVKEESKVPREHKSALKKAESYAKTMNMSKASIYDQLISEYGENFPKESADYAMENIEANWNENALKKAETYASTMDMSNSAIYDQLISEYGEKFTKEEAQYAMDNLE